MNFNNANRNPLANNFDDPDVDFSPVSTVIIPLVGSTGLGVTVCVVVVVVLTVEGSCGIGFVVVGDTDDGSVNGSVVCLLVENAVSGVGVDVVASDTNLTTNFSTPTSLPVRTISIGTFGTIP